MVPVKQVTVKFIVFVHGAMRIDGKYNLQNIKLLIQMQQCHLNIIISFDVHFLVQFYHEDILDQENLSKLRRIADLTEERYIDKKTFQNG